MTLLFEGEVIHWRGPAPYVFVRVPADVCPRLREAAREVSYGWGVVPVTARIGATRWSTSLFPREGGYLVPVRRAVQAAEDVQVDDRVTVELTIGR